MTDSIIKKQMPLLVGFSISLICGVLIENTLFSMLTGFNITSALTYLFALLLIGTLTNLSSFVISGSSAVTGVVAALVLLFDAGFDISRLFQSFTVILSTIVWAASAYLSISIGKRVCPEKSGLLSLFISRLITSTTDDDKKDLQEEDKAERSPVNEQRSESNLSENTDHNDLPELEVMQREILNISSSDDSYVEHRIRQYSEVENIAGYAVSVPRYSMSSTLHEDFNQDIWTQEPDGKEKCRHFNNCYIEARAGHKIDLIKLENGPIEFLYNRNTEVLHSLHRYIVTPETYSVSIGNMPQVVIAMFVGVIIPYLNVVVALLATIDTFKRRKGYVSRSYLGPALPAFCAFLWVFSLLVTIKVSENGLSNITMDGIIQYAMVWGSASVILYLVAMKHTKTRIEAYLQKMVNKVKTVI